MTLTKHLIPILMLFAFSSAPAASKPAKVSILFFQDQATLPLEARERLSPLLTQYKRHKGEKPKRFFITAYAALPDKPSWKAFRLSLQRALALEQYLQDHLVVPKHIILRPKGNACSDPCQRVEVELR